MDLNTVTISKNTGLPNLFDALNDKFYKVNPVVLFVLTLILLIFFVLLHYLGGSGSGPGTNTIQTSKGLNTLEILLWGIFIFLIMANGLQYFFNINIRAGIKNLFTETPEINLEISGDDIMDEKKIQPKKSEVYHIGDNTYTYNDARAVCKAYNGKLATYKQVEGAYKQDGEWCSYGWSENQMALFPTQQKTWDLLQKKKGHENDCGRPGINGGFIDNKMVRFGVNCFGIKPNPTQDELSIMNTTSSIPKTKEERLLEKRVNYFKKNIEKILISPFNNQFWNRSKA
jgi:hypothetical protein